MSCQTQSTVLLTSALRKPAGCYSETRSRSNGNWCVSILKDTNVIKLTFGYKSWLYLLDITQFGCFWCLWPKMVFKMSQEFPTTSLDITKLSSSFFLFFFVACMKILFQSALISLMWSRRLQKPLEQTMEPYVPGATVNLSTFEVVVAVCMFFLLQSLSCFLSSSDLLSSA